MNIIKELRKKAGIQQKDLADIIGVSRPVDLGNYMDGYEE